MVTRGREFLYSKRADRNASEPPRSLVNEPQLEFMQRLATLVPRSRLDLIRFHGVLALNAKLRPRINLGEKKNKSNPSGTSDDVPQSATSARISWARLLK